MEKIIQVALVDDHKIFRDGVKVAMKDREHINIAWEAENGKDMLNKMKLKKPDVVLMDLKMPELDGVKAMQFLKKEYDDLKIIILSMYDDKETINKMIEIGASGYLTKTTDADEIYKAIKGCVKDGVYINELVKAALVHRLQEKKATKKFAGNRALFNENELKILKLISEDKTTEEISEEVCLCRRTVEAIRQNMKSKVGAKTIPGLLMYAIRNRLLD